MPLERVARHPGGDVDAPYTSLKGGLACSLVGADACLADRRAEAGHAHDTPSASHPLSVAEEQVTSRCSGPGRTGRLVSPAVGGSQPRCEAGSGYQRMGVTCIVTLSMSNRCPHTVAGGHVSD